MNPVERRILELASPQLGKRQKIIREVRRKVVIQNRRYSWQLFEHPTDSQHLETVLLDVNLDEAIEIDRKVAERFTSSHLFAGSEDCMSSPPRTGKIAS